MKQKSKWEREVFFEIPLTNSGGGGIINKHSGNVCYGTYAGVAELADARDLKSRVTRVTYRFDPGLRHHPIP